MKKLKSYFVAFLLSGLIITLTLFLLKKINVPEGVYQFALIAVSALSGLIIYKKTKTVDRISDD
ncbi:MAG: hypothetical protein CSA38_02535 [Flavobacteriales bacterium]|nr:MAG: hypothetical protein CSA38_02535 [Flavobacteriales bacterium]